ncbi:hypothetical protein DESC_870008 [Desulfosarcina cetonica]|nr:hypothetical protein DESC_870008 [Desulfosarcina cetonica]
MIFKYITITIRADQIFMVGNYRVFETINNDGFVKSPISALRFIPRHCGVRNSTPHSSGFASLDLGLFTNPSEMRLFTSSSTMGNR